MHGGAVGRSRRRDSSGHYLRDQRTEAECEWLTSTVGAAELLELTSNPALTNFTLPKLMWVRTHEPDVWNRVRHVLLPKDFIQLRLSGRCLWTSPTHRAR